MKIRVLVVDDQALVRAGFRMVLEAEEDMEVIGRPAIQTAAKPRFQIFTSGLGARFTFLLDTEIGNTWQVVVGTRKAPDGTEYEVNVWQPFAK